MAKFTTTFPGFPFQRKSFYDENVDNVTNDPVVIELQDYIGEPFEEPLLDPGRTLFGSR
jgi:hypothetical protein